MAMKSVLEPTGNPSSNLPIFWGQAGRYLISPESDAIDLLEDASCMADIAGDVLAAQIQNVPEEHQNRLWAAQYLTCMVKNVVDAARGRLSGDARKNAGEGATA
jgi:hypothetical protein